MLGRSSAPASSNSTTAGVMPVTPTAATSAASMPARFSNSRLMAQTLSHHCAGFSSAQPGCGDDSSTARLATPSTWSGSRSRMPMVEVVPISSPSTQLIGTPRRWRATPASAQTADNVHETLHACAVDGIPRIAVHLEVGPDDHARYQAQDLGDIVDIDTGIGKDRDVGDGLGHAAQIRLAGRLPG